MVPRWLGKERVGSVPITILSCFARPAGKAYGGVNRFTDRELNLKLNVQEHRVSNRNSLLEQMDHDLGQRIGSDVAYDQLDHFRRMAADMLIGSPVRDAYDLDKEDPRIREMYGDHMGGQTLLTFPTSGRGGSSRRAGSLLR